MTDRSGEASLLTAGSGSEPGGDPDAAGQLTPWRSGLVVLCGFVGMTAGFSSTYLYTSGLFLLPVAQDFGISRGQASLAPLLCTLTAAAVAPLLGQILDRVGAVIVALLSLLGLGLGFLLLGAFSYELTSYAALSVLLAILGSGSAGLSFSRLIVSATTQRRGVSLGFVMAGAGFGALVLPPLLMPIILEQGWRTAYQALAMLPLAAAGVLAAVLLPLRRHLAPSRKSEAGGGVGGSGLFRQPWRYPHFWAISSLFFVLAMASVSLVVHFVPIQIGAGEPPLDAARVAGLIGLSSIPGRLLMGFLLDRYALGRLALLVVATALIVTGLLAVDPARFSVPAAVLLGLVMGAESDLIAFYTLRYFPQARYGSAFGAISGLFLVGCATGPFIAAHLHDLTQSYFAALMVIALMFAGALVLVRRLPSPQPGPA